MNADPSIAHSLKLQRRGYRVIVEQDPGQITVYLGRREPPAAEDVKASAGTFAGALERAAQTAGSP